MNAMPTQPIDEELALLRAGKTSAACERIVTLYGPLVKSACRRVLRDEGLAEDAAQETFVLLVKKAPSLPPDTALAGWLYHAACRTALNHQRAAMRRRVRENSTEAMNQMTPETQPNLWTEIEPHLDEAMLALPDRQRDLVVQCYFQNQSQRSAAAALGCSESVVSRELNAAIEALRRFFSKRSVAVSSVALAALLPAHAASASMVSGTAMVTAMMATPTSSTLLAALLQSKVLITTAAVAGTVTVAAVGYQWTSSRRDTADFSNRSGSLTVSSGGSSSRNGTASNQRAVPAKKGNWVANFQFTSAMELDERKKQVLLERDSEIRYGLLQKMGVGLSRAGFDQLIAKGMDASVAEWRDTFHILTNHTDDFDNYLMAWSNEAPLDALNWVTAQPDGGKGMRKQLLYVLATKQIQPDALRQWISSVKNKSMQQEATIAVESIGNSASLIAKIGTGGNEGFLVDLAMLQGGKDLDWTAFGRKLATGKKAIIGRAMRLAIEEQVAPEHLEKLILALSQSPDQNVSAAAVILRATQADAGIDYVKALALADSCERAGMTDFSWDIFRGWAVADPQAALRYTGGLKNLAGMRQVIRALPNIPDDATLLAWMAGTPTKAQDIALSALYGRTSKGPFDQLQKVMQSNNIIDQVEAAQEVMRSIPLAEAPAAAQWLKQLPMGKERQLVASALFRRLSDTDPKLTLELVQSEGLTGPDCDRGISNAVIQFAAQNDLAKSTQFIQQITDPKLHGQALGQLAMIKFPGHPQEAFTYLQANSKGDWQPAALRMLSDIHYNKLGNIDANAAEILKLDLQRLGPDTAIRTSNLCRIWFDHQPTLAVPLLWTQQLPEPIARQTRLQLARNNELRPAGVEQFQAWVETAAISPAERSKLQTVLSKRLGTTQAAP